MRSRWEEKYGKEEKEDRTDEPVTITEGQLRSLKRGATIGMVSAVLAIVAMGIAGYSLVSARNIGSEMTAVKQSAATDQAAQAAQATPAPTTAPAVQPTGAATPTAAATPAAAAAQPAAVAASKPVQETQTPHLARTVKATSRKATARAQRAANSGMKPETMPATGLAPSPVTSDVAKPAIPPPSASPTPAPVPVGAEPAKPKPAARDTSSAH